MRSNSFLLKQGLPQGSSISPLLFLVYINDIDVDLDPQTTASLFADDTATWLKDGEIRGSNRKLAQREVKKIQAWAVEWKMSINTSKTNCMITSTKPDDLKWDPQLQISGNKISPVSQYKFLGVTITNNLRFVEHANKLVQKCRARVNILKCLATKDWGNSTETQRTLYVQYIRSVLEYASSSWHGWMATTHIKRLQRIQNEALRSIAGLAKTCPIDFLHLETGIEPVAVRLAKNDEITWDRYERLPEDDARNQLIKKEHPTNLKTRFGFRDLTSKRLHHKDIVRETTTPPLEPWQTLPNLQFESVPLERKKEEYTKEELKAMTVAKIESLDKPIHIYTDGSTSGDQKNGGAGIYVETREGEKLHEESWPAGSLCSSYTGECVAFLRALEWIERVNEQDVLICTDSKSLQESLRSNSWKDTDIWLKKKRT